MQQGTGKGERTMSRGFIAQYAAEAALATPGVLGLEQGTAAALKEAFGYHHEGAGVRVEFTERDEASCIITVYPYLRYGLLLPEVAWNLQERVKKDVEKYTGLNVEAVHVHVKDILQGPDEVSESWLEEEGELL